MKSLEQLYDRFNNLLEVRKIQQSDVIQAGFDEDDLKSIIYHLGELKAIKQSGIVKCKDCKHCVALNCGYECDAGHWNIISKEGNCGGMGDFYCAAGEERE